MVSWRGGRRKGPRKYATASNQLRPVALWQLIIALLAFSCDYNHWKYNSLPRWASTVSVLWALGICCCQPNCLELTERWSAWSDAYHWQFQTSALILGCFQSTSTYSALDVSHFMRWINLWITYELLTYLQCQSQTSLPVYNTPYTSLFSWLLVTPKPSLLDHSPAGHTRVIVGPILSDSATAAWNSSNYHQK